LRKFAEVYGALRQSHVESLDHEVMIRAAIDGLLRLDPNGAYYDAEEFKELQAGLRSGVGSVGLEVTERRRAVRIVSAIEDSPAARAGLKPDDVITKIDDHDIADLKLAEAVKLLRGKAGTRVTVSVQRPGEQQLRVVDLIREIIRVRAIKSRLVNSNVAYVRIAQFQETAAESVAKEIAALSAQAQLRLLVLDLRSSPGGLLHSCVATAALFLPENALILRTDGRDADSRREFRAVGADYLRRGQIDPKPLLPVSIRDIPIAVLIDRGTASGSEFVAAALRDHQRATIFGQHSFGRGLVQTIYPLHPSGAVRMTTARYYSPSGGQIEGVGIKPDVVVPDDVAMPDFGTEMDPVLRAAIAQLLR
jgi:carboxyl-terminal processing protease